MRAADEFTATYARRCTEVIGTPPTVHEALRFCYYMRSQTVDTYARFEDGVMLLLLADQACRDRSRDRVYWRQCLFSDCVLNGCDEERGDANTSTGGYGALGAAFSSLMGGEARGERSREAVREEFRRWRGELEGLVGEGVGMGSGMGSGLGFGSRSRSGSGSELGPGRVRWEGRMRRWSSSY